MIPALCHHANEKFREVQQLSEGDSINNGKGVINFDLSGLEYLPEGTDS